jgi:His/Glu/Gln/Arg/opine family amino acid ABC transporter permease subunit
VGNWSPFAEPAIWSFLAGGLALTLQIALAAGALSLVGGVALALARLSAWRPLALIAGVYVEIARALPLFLIILYTFLAAPRLGVSLDPLPAAIVALTLYTSAVMAEIVRAGIASLARGQTDAARALGMSYIQTLRFVVLPQALRRMTPALVSQLITLTKDTSLASLIGVNELARRAGILYNTYFNPVETLLLVAGIYFALCASLGALSRRLEPREGRVVAVDVGEEDQVRVPTGR